MKALILAGGTGTRLRPLTYSLPKQLIPVANKPIILYAVEHLKNCGINDIGVIISPETGYQIIETLNRNREDISFTFIEQSEPLGLAHAVKVSQNYLKDSSFIMYLGDNMIGDGIQNILDDFTRSNSDASILLKKTEDPRKFGVAELDQSGKIRKLVEKPENPISNLALVGIYIFTKAIHGAIAKITPSKRGELEITDAIQEMINSNHKVSTNILDSWWIDTGKKDDLLYANMTILQKHCNQQIDGQIDHKSLITGPVIIEKGAKIKNSFITGPAVIGANTSITNSNIDAFTSIGSNCIVEKSNISKSVILSGVKISNIHQITNSLIGYRAIVTKSHIQNNPMNLIIGDDTEVLL